MSKTLDTTVIIKGLLEPRRKKQDGIFREQMRIYKTASSMLDEIHRGGEKLFMPTVAIIETAAVAARITGDENIGLKAATAVKSLAFKIISESELLDEAVATAAKTKISGFDSVFIACAKLTSTVLITDDKRMYEAAIKAGVNARLLRDIGK